MGRKEHEVLATRMHCAGVDQAAESYPIPQLKCLSQVFADNLRGNIFDMFAPVLGHRLADRLGECFDEDAGIPEVLIFNVEDGRLRRKSREVEDHDISGQPELGQEWLGAPAA